MEQRHNGLQLRIVLLILVVAAPAFWAIADTSRRHQRDQRQMARKTTADLARVTAGHYERTIDNAEHVLKAMARMDAVRGGDVARMQERFRQLRAQYPEYTNLAAVRPDGRVWASAASSGEDMDVSDRTWFTRARATRRLSVGNYETGPVTGQTVLSVARPVEATDDGLAMVLVCPISLEWIARVKPTMRLPAAATVSLVDSEGTILARQPGHEKYHGKPAEELDLRPLTDGKPSQLYQATPPDGEERLYAVLPVESANSNLHMALSVPTSYAFRHARDVTMRNMALLALAVILTVLLAWFWSHRLIVRPIRDIVEASRQMRQGDLSARISEMPETKELAELAENLNKTAGALQESLVHREDARRELNREQKLLTHIARTSPVGIVVIGPDGRITFANPRARNLLNITLEESDRRYDDQAWNITDWHGDPVPEEDFTFPKVLREGHTIYHQHLAVKPAGAEERILLNINAAPMEMDTGTGVIAAFEDVTQRVRYARKVRNLARFPDESPMPVMRVSVSGQVLYGNRPSAGLLAALGIDEHGALPAPWPQRLQDMHEKNTREEFELAVDDQFLSVMAVPVSGQDYVNFYVYDVTERRRLAEQLRQSQKMEAIGQLAGGIAHDFNNIVTGIVGFSDFVIEEMDPESQAGRDMQQVKKLAERAAHLTGQLLAFSRRQTLNPTILDINKVLGNLGQMLQRIIGEDVEFEFEPDDNLGEVRADPSQMEQVLMNLAVNARDAMPEGGRLTVRTSNVTIGQGHTEEGVPVAAGDYVLVNISDTGSGMPPEVCERAFEPFFTTKEQGKGTGLGLATVYGIIKQQGGYIWIDSKPGEGTTFRIYLPRVDQSAEHPEPDTEVIPEQLRGRTVTVLVVDDEAPVTRLTARVLRGAGYRVLTAKTAAEALDLAQRYATDLDLLLADVVLCDCSGAELHEQISEKVSGLPVLYMSGYADDTVERHGVRQEDTPLLQKPFSPQQLLQEVAGVLE